MPKTWSVNRQTDSILVASLSFCSPANLKVCGFVWFAWDGRPCLHVVTVGVATLLLPSQCGAVSRAMGRGRRPLQCSGGCCLALYDSCTLATCVDMCGCILCPRGDVYGCDVPLGELQNCGSNDLINPHRALISKCQFTSETDSWFSILLPLICHVSFVSLSLVENTHTQERT